MVSNSMSVQPLSPVLKLVPKFQLLTSRMFDKALFNCQERVDETTLDIIFEFWVAPKFSGV